MSDEELMDSTEIESVEQTEEVVSEVPETEAESEDELSLEEKIAKAGEDGGEKGEEDEDEPIAASAEGEGDKYEANYKFTAGDEEHEIDEALKPLITTPEIEEKLRDLHERAYGLDSVKESRDYYKDNFQQYKGALEKQTGAINTLSEYLDNGDLSAFFQALDIPAKDVMQYALVQAQQQEWTPQQRQAYDQAWEDKRRANLYQQQYNTKESEIESLRQDQVVKDFQLELHKPDVQDFMKAFDERNGKDAFRSEVADLGAYHEKVHGNVLEVGHLVKAVMDKFGPLMQQVAPTAQPAVQNTQAVAQPKEVPTIPNTGPGGQAPAAPVIKSLADLEKIASQA